MNTQFKSMILQRKQKIVLSLCLVILISLIVFIPCFRSGFTNFDDNDYVVKNPIIRDLTPAGIVRIFIPSTYTIEHPNAPQLYVPLVALSYALEYRLVGLDPLIYHTTNLILHLLNCVLVFWFIFMLTDEMIIALLVAIFFGIHPLQVESVAWITERKNVLFAFFFLASLISHCYYLKKNKPAYYFLTILLFILALFSKPVAFTLPLVLLLCDYFVKGNLSRDKVLEKLPMFIIAVLFLSLSGVPSHRYLRFDPDFRFYDNFLVSGYALWFYVAKLFIPIRLSCLYPYPLKINNFLPAEFLIASFLAIILGCLAFFTLRYTKKVIFGSLFFLVTILPYLQTLPNGPTIVADRYTYLSLVGLFFIIAYCLQQLYLRKFKKKRIPFAILIATIISIILTLSVLTWQRCKVWKNSLSLWEDAINKYPNGYIPIAFFGRAMVYSESGLDRKAMSDFDKALMLYYKKLKISKDYWAIYNRMIASEHGYSLVYNYLAVKFAEIDRAKEATLLLDRAIKTWPLNIDAYLNLISVYGNSGKLKDAISIGRRTAELFPSSAEACHKLSVAYFLGNQPTLACQYFHKAIKLGLDPKQDALGIREKCTRRDSLK